MESFRHPLDHHRIKRAIAPLADGSPAQIGHAAHPYRGAKNPELSEGDHFAASFQNQVAEIFCAPANLAVGIRLVEICVVEKFQQEGPLLRRYLTRGYFPRLVRHRLLSNVQNEIG